MHEPDFANLVWCTLLFLAGDHSAHNSFFCFPHWVQMIVYRYTDDRFIGFLYSRTRLLPLTRKKKKKDCQLYGE